MYHQHVIDWYRMRGYRVTVLSDWSFMVVSEAALASSDPVRMEDEIRRRLAAKWRKK